MVSRGNGPKKCAAPGCGVWLETLLYLVNNQLWCAPCFRRLYG